ncbi:hypothetical protein WJX72_011291 [[Myrmecia] bisecta]|uniref:3-beta hydroxysteroid dehydrogenase/isomerase domain-containing protein n=1 Tax=[Myrmecia] bisecta TaxID=41462 RepID=A0AAW1QGI4_9CHLO
MVATRSTKQKCLVTGGAGFLGKHLVDQLAGSGAYEVTVFDIRDTGDTRVMTIVGDLRDPIQVDKACEGLDVVFHCATAAPSAANVSNKRLMHDVNVKGTQHIVDACIKHGVPKLVYTSSASVVFEGRSLYNADESTPYAARPMDYYTETKILGEKAILAANGKGKLATVALRPSGIFGEGDPLLVPIAVEKAKQGKMKYIIGSGDNLMDYTYVGNVAQAHIQAGEALIPGSRIAGKAYFISNDDPQPFWGFLGDVLEPLGYGRPRIHLPWLLIFIIAWLLENIITPLLKPIKEIKPSEFTTQRVTIAACNRTFTCERAKKDFGYKPKVSVQEGLKRTVAAFQHLQAAPHPTKGKKA